MVGAVILAGLATAVGLAYAGRWQWLAYAAIPVLAGVLGLVLALVGLVTLRRAAAESSRRSQRWGRGLLLAGLFLVIQLASFPVALTWRDQEVRQAQDFIAALVPRLEDYQRQHGAYPDAVDAVLAADRSLPALLQLSDSFPLVYDNRNFYLRRETSYAFQFYLPDGFIGFRYDYCCGADGSWTVTD